MIVLITGATDGLGRALARALDAAGATVLVHGRSDERIADTLGELSDRARGYRADLASLVEVRRLADDVLAAEPRLDVLVNNAGIGTTVPGEGERLESADGHELRFAVNYLSGYLLTRSLLALLRRSAPARVVNVSSAGQAPIDFDDVMLERHYSGVQAYCQSRHRACVVYRAVPRFACKSATSGAGCRSVPDLCGRHRGVFWAPSRPPSVS